MSDKKIDYRPDIRKYVARVDEGAVEEIVRHLGIALHYRDSATVSASDRSELGLLRDGFVKKKLAVTETDTTIDSAIRDVMQKMAADQRKSRVTVCYLLAERFGKLELFSKHKPGTESRVTPKADSSRGAQHHPIIEH